MDIIASSPLLIKGIPLCTPQESKKSSFVTATPIHILNLLSFSSETYILLTRSDNLVRATRSFICILMLWALDSLASTTELPSRNVVWKSSEVERFNNYLHNQPRQTKRKIQGQLLPYFQKIRTQVKHFENTDLLKQYEEASAYYKEYYKIQENAVLKFLPQSEQLEFKSYSLEISAYLVYTQMLILQEDILEYGSRGIFKMELMQTYKEHLHFIDELVEYLEDRSISNTLKAQRIGKSFSTIIESGQFLDNEDISNVVQKFQGIRPKQGSQKVINYINKIINGLSEYL